MFRGFCPNLLAPRMRVSLMIRSCLSYPVSVPRVFPSSSYSNISCSLYSQTGRATKLTCTVHITILITGVLVGIKRRLHLSKNPILHHGSGHNKDCLRYQAAERRLVNSTAIGSRVIRIMDIAPAIWVHVQVDGRSGGGVPNPGTYGIRIRP